MKTSDMWKVRKKHPIFIENEVMINEAIKELEELENRSCDNCKYFHQSYLCLELGKGNIQPKEIGLNYCNEWKSKNENL